MFFKKSLYIYSFIFFINSFKGIIAYSNVKPDQYVRNLLNSIKNYQKLNKKNLVNQIIISNLNSVYISKKSLGIHADKINNQKFQEYFKEYKKHEAIIANNISRHIESIDKYTVEEDVKVSKNYYYVDVLVNTDIDYLDIIYTFILERQSNGKYLIQNITYGAIDLLKLQTLQFETTIDNHGIDYLIKNIVN